VSAFITRRALSRRAVLRGAGAAVALPFLDAMAPAMTASAKPPRRLGYVYAAMGADMSRWTPAAEGPLEALPPILEPLAPVRERVAVITNTELRNAYPGTHATSNSAFLSAARAKHTESSDYRLATTVDQIAAKRIGGETRLPSLELAMDLLQIIGQCDNGYACVYQNNLSWSSPTTPLPSEAHPRLVFEKLFGEGGSPEERKAALRKRASLLDFVKEDLARLERSLGPADRGRVSAYLEAVRDVERRIGKAEEEAGKGALPDLERPVGVPAAYAEHARLMFELQRLAFQGDVTRIISFQLTRETSNRTYPETGVTDPHHPLSHHGNDPAKVERMSKINRFHVSLFAEHVAKLKEIPDGDGALIDHVAWMYGSGMGNPNVHDHENLPILVAGRIAGKGGRHVRFARKTPLANVHLTLLERAGVRLDAFADSDGKIDGLFEPADF
jgi:hypothetical protein